MNTSKDVLFAYKIYITYSHRERLAALEDITGQRDVARKAFDDLRRLVDCQQCTQTVEH